MQTLDVDSWMILDDAVASRNLAEATERFKGQDKKVLAMSSVSSVCMSFGESPRTMMDDSAALPCFTEKAASSQETG